MFFSQASKQDVFYVFFCFFWGGRVLGLWFGRIGFGSAVAGAGVVRFGLVMLVEVYEDTGLLP